MRILGIETSCDETAAAVVEITRGQFSVLSNVVASQVKIHAKTGGVVPEVAARAHVEVIIPVVERALCEANGESQMAKRSARHALGNLRYAASIDAIAVTAGPGLVTSLLVGVEVARTLSWLWRKPVIAVNHLAGHVYANWLNANGREYHGELSRIEFPALCLVVSGGHTELVLMRRHLDFKVVGSTRDDAAGEAFDKVAKMLGLPYPGGPAIAQLAAQWNFQFPISNFQSNSKFQITKNNHLITQSLNNSITFPRPMIDSPDFDFSFSGLKTAVLYYLKKQKTRNKKQLTQICHEFQEAVVDVLVSKTVRAARKYRVKTVLLGGGVAANARLRQQLSAAIKRQLPTTSYVLPSLQYTTDNAAMIAAAGCFMARAKQFTPWQKLDVDPNWELGKKFKPIPR